MQLIFGSRVMGQLTGKPEAEKGRFTVYQEPYPGDERPGEKIECWLFGPEEELRALAAELDLLEDREMITPSFRFEGDTAAFLERIRELRPGVELLNADDDEVLATKICPEEFGAPA